MLPIHRLQMEQSEKRQRINELLGQDEVSDEERGELGALTTRAQQLEVEMRAAIVAQGDTETRPITQDAEHRERLDLRGRATLTNYLLSAAQGRVPSGAELELRQAAGVQGIPVELFEVRTDDSTVAPATGTGVNVDVVRPLIYARAILPRVGVSMPMVESGGYSTMTISTGLTAGAMAAGAPREADAAVLTPKTTVPHRVSARLRVRLEDIALVGSSSYESALRQALVLALSDELDRLGLTGDNVDPNPQGLLPQLTDPTDPSAVVDFDGFVQAVSDGCDGGPWAENMTSIMLVTNAETMRLAERTFQATSTYKGEISAASYLRTHAAGFLSNRRMPDTDAMIAQALRFRSGTMGLENVNAMRVAVCPMWGSVDITDIYTDSAAGITNFNMHNLIGDVLIEQPNAFERVDLKVS